MLPYSNFEPNVVRIAIRKSRNILITKYDDVLFVYDSMIYYKLRQRELDFAAGPLVQHQELQTLTKIVFT